MMNKRTTELPSTKFQWARPPPRILVTAESTSFDQKILQALRSEGFQTSYLRYDGDRKAFGNKLFKVAEPLQLGDYWGILAFGSAAAASIDACMKPISKLSALVAYYPTAFPNTKTGLPPNLVTVIHLAGDQKLGPAPGPRYNYPNARAGFAESDSECFDAVASDLSWTRTLTALRKAFGSEMDLEAIWEKYLTASFVQNDVERILDTLADDATVNYFPTMMGGDGKEKLKHFYQNFFVNKNPKSMKMRLVSRTIGFDRLVDEMLLTFDHTHEFPWMLPGVKPTNKHIEVAMVIIVGIRAKKIYSIHNHWDQATVLAQAGLINSANLPASGVESARKLVHNGKAPSNPISSTK